MDIKGIIEGLDLVESVTPDYSLSRHKNINDDEVEKFVNKAVCVASDALESAIILLEEIRRNIRVYSNREMVLMEKIDSFLKDDLYDFYLKENNYGKTDYL